MEPNHSEVKAAALGPRGIVRRLAGSCEKTPEFSICTMLISWSEYQEFLSSFFAGGFTSLNSEFLVIDNSDVNVADAYQCVNEFLQSALADSIILVHHDVRLMAQGADDLRDHLDKLTKFDPNWGLCGNAGHTFRGEVAICISHPYRLLDVEGPFPRRVVSLDENLIVVRRLANLSASADLSGFHHYGPDLCTIADILGWSSYVIDFLVRHNSAGKFDLSYSLSSKRFEKKFSRALRSRWIHLITRQPVFISGSFFERQTSRFRLRINKFFWKSRTQPKGISSSSGHLRLLFCCTEPVLLPLSTPSMQPMRRRTARRRDARRCAL